MTLYAMYSSHRHLRIALTFSVHSSGALRLPVTCERLDGLVSVVHDVGDVARLEMPGDENGQRPARTQNNWASCRPSPPPRTTGPPVDGRERSQDGRHLEPLPHPLAERVAGFALGLFRHVRRLVARVDKELREEHDQARAAGAVGQPAAHPCAGRGGRTSFLPGHVACLTTET